MKKIYFLMVAFGLFFVMGCNISPEIKRTNNLNENIKLLSDERLGDQAYVNIIKIGLPAVPLLLKNSSNMMIFNGNKVYNPASSLLVGKPTVGLVSLYLIDCIIMNEETPHLAPLIVTKEGTFKDKKGLPNTNGELIRQATVIYEKWWEKNKYLNKAEIQKISPLAGTNLSWWGMRPLEE